MSLFPRRLAQPQPQACPEPVSLWVGKLAPHPLGTAGLLKGSQEQIKPGGCKCLEAGGKEESCGFRAGSPPPSMQRFHEHSRNKAEMLKNKNNPAKGSQRVLLGQRHGLDMRG